MYHYHILALILWFGGLLGCSKDLSAPVPPDMEDVANKFFDLKGSLDSENASALGEFMLSDGGAALLGGGVLLQSFLPEWAGNTNEGRDGESNDGDSSFAGDGWMIVTLNCGDEDSEFKFYSLFSQEGLEPYLWGEAKNCIFGEDGEDGLGLDGSIAFFLPLEVGYIAPTGWDGPAGVWMSIEGKLDFGDTHLSGEYHLMLGEDDTTQLLWENGSARFVLILDFDPETLGDPYALLDLSLTVKTGNGDWVCDYETLGCTGPNGEGISL